MFEKKYKSRKVNSADEQNLAVTRDEYLTLTYLEAIEKVESYASQYLKKEKEDLRILDFGAAGGVSKFLRPNWLTCDVRESTSLDFLIDLNMNIPLEDSTLDVIYLQDTLHHIQDLDKFLTEALRLLGKDGLIICREPYWSVPAQIVWRFIHPEDFSLKNIESFLYGKKKDSPMEGNQALGWYLSRSKSKILNTKLHLLNKFRIRFGEKSNGIAFLLSGGANFTTNINRKFLIKLHKREANHQNWLRLMGFSVWIIFERK